MTEIERIIEELKNIHNGNAWHGASLADALREITFERAAASPLPAAHSIWEIAAHIAAWEDVFRRRFEGQATSEPEEGDFPAPSEKSEKTWSQMLKKLDDVHEKLVDAVRRLPDSILDENINERDYTYRFLLGKAIDHKIYHTGQIALLKKALPI